MVLFKPFTIAVNSRNGLQNRINCRMLKCTPLTLTFPHSLISRCLEHVVNLANVDVMAHITRVAMIETLTAIWEFDPSLPNNCLHGNSLNVIAAIQTVAIKIQASGQHIEYFQKLQVQCDIKTPLKIPLHGNTRWGSVFNMLDRAYKLRKAINMFLSSADELYGLITTIRKNNRIFKKIPWSAFKMSEDNWQLVYDVKSILADSQRLLHTFSSEK